MIVFVFCRGSRPGFPKNEIRFPVVKLVRVFEFSFEREIVRSWRRECFARGEIPFSRSRWRAGGPFFRNRWRAGSAFPQMESEEFVFPEQMESGKCVFPEGARPFSQNRLLSVDNVLARTIPP